MALLETQELPVGLSKALDESDTLAEGEPDTTPDALMVKKWLPGGLGETVKVGEWESEAEPDTLLQAVVL